MGTSLKRKKFKIIILFEFPGQQGAKTVCMKTSIKRLWKEISLDDNIYDLEKKVQHGCSRLKEGRILNFSYLYSPTKGFKATAPRNGSQSVGVHFPSAAVWWLQSQLRAGTEEIWTQFLGNGRRR